MSVLIADCGSTKTEWAIVSPGAAPRIIRTTGFNAAISSPEDIQTILQAELRPQIADETIGQLFFYGAGCIGGDTDRRLASLLEKLIPDAVIEIAGDLAGAARALFGDKPGIACILGTGSNMGIYDGNGIVLNTPPMGYILGDEGSGAVLGRNLLNLIFKHPGHLPQDIIDDFNATYGLTKADIIQRVYRQPAANRFLASFAPFLKKHIDVPSIGSLLSDSFQSFLSANLPYPKASDSSPLSSDLLSDSLPLSDLPIGFIGSIAYHFAPILTSVCAANGFKDCRIMQHPLPALITYHTI